MIIEAITALRKDLKNLDQILEAIKIELSDSKNVIKIAGKTLRQANLEQPAQFAYYDEIRVHLQTLSNLFEIRLSKRRAELLRMLSENSSYEYGERMKEKLIDEDEKFLEMKLQKLEVDEVLEIANSISKQFEQRSYTLNNITKLVVAQAQDEFLTLD